MLLFSTLKKNVLFLCAVAMCFSDAAGARELKASGELLTLCRRGHLASFWQLLVLACNTLDECTHGLHWAVF